MLIYFDSKRTLFIDVDSSKVGGIDAIIYYLDGDKPGPKKYPNRKHIRLILFLSRLLKNAETRYWPTELKLAEIIWVLIKVRYMIDTATKTVIYTDYDIALGIAKQITLTTSSTNKLNLRLVRASNYIQRFRNIEFRYKLDSRYIVPNALSRLSYTQSKNESEGELDTLWGHAYVVTVLVEMTSKLKAKILQEYQDDKGYTRVLKVLDANNNADENVVNLSFFRGKNDLI